MRRESFPKTRLFVFLAVLWVTAGASAQQGPSGADRLAIERVIRAFNSTAEQRDRAGFLELFLPGHVGWQSIADDFQLAREKKRFPAATKAWMEPGSSHVTFIDKAIGDSRKVTGTTERIVIDTDGHVASAGFDYVRRIDGREAGNGRAVFLLVNTERGWKIASAAYSKRGPRAPTPVP